MKSIAELVGTHLTAYQAGDFEVWYMKEESFRDFSLYGYTNNVTKFANYKQSHTPIGCLGADAPVVLFDLAPNDNIPERFIDALERIFFLMQGEKWSPNGEARNAIGNSEAGHTSMSIGDIVVANCQMGPVAVRVAFAVTKDGFMQI